jgi:hypothetical protein
MFPFGCTHKMAELVCHKSTSLLVTDMQKSAMGVPVYNLGEIFDYIVICITLQRSNWFFADVSLTLQDT